ncbi:helix-turn-helix domain-containing protein [Streptomyces prasinus]|uniref:helix-turn-helix domain-containing protein n=1 Tax=Streptomyces prasinus TaxID=67345 RepID=UPI0036A9E8CB
MTTAVREAPHHRNLTCVKEYRCRRPDCVARSQAYERRRYRQKGYGTWQPLVDATPARQHIAALREAGHSIPDIQRQARVGSATLARILYDGVNKRAERIRPEVAERILAVPVGPAPIKPNTIIDATGTRRRLQALVSMGWTLNALGPRLSFHPRRLTDLMYADRVLASTARRIAEGYRIAQTLDPVAHGVPKRSASLSRNLAAREGWHGPLAWDDIDDPAAKPEALGRKRRPGTGVSKIRADVQRVAQLTAAGKSAQQIADELGCHKRTVVRARGRVTPEVLEAAA